MAVGVAPGEVVPAEIGVVAAVGEQVPAGDQDGAADGYGGLLLADPVGHRVRLGRQVSVPGTGGGPGTLGEDAGQPPQVTPSRVTSRCACRYIICRGSS